MRSPAPTARPADVAEMAARLRLSATRLARRLRQQADSGFTLTQLSALAVIDGHGPLTLGALAELERVAPPSITKVVTKLEAEGLVERAIDPADRRVTYVTTTRAGRDLLAESRRRKTTWLTARIRELPADEQARLADALDVLDHLTSLDDLP
jgi:DNA-binding MarR family transcriptional regulator